MSIGSVIVTPTPIAAPLTAAMIGFPSAKMRRVSSPPLSRRRASSGSSSRENAYSLVRSMPAQKARPAPVTMTTRIPLSWSTWSSAAISSSFRATE